MESEMETNLAHLVVWSLFVGSAIQMIIHGITYFVLRKQYSVTRVGKTLIAREGSLAIKAFCRAIIDLILSVIVTWDFWLFNVYVREAIYLAATASVLAAAWYGIAYLDAIWEYRRGIPDPRVEREGTA